MKELYDFYTQLGDSEAMTHMYFNSNGAECTQGLPKTFPLS